MTYSLTKQIISVWKLDWWMIDRKKGSADWAMLKLGVMIPPMIDFICQSFFQFQILKKKKKIPLVPVIIFHSR